MAGPPLLSLVAIMAGLPLQALVAIIVILRFLRAVLQSTARMMVAACMSMQDARNWTLLQVGCSALFIFGPIYFGTINCWLGECYPKAKPHPIQRTHNHGGETVLVNCPSKFAVGVGSGKCRTLFMKIVTICHLPRIVVRIFARMIAVGFKTQDWRNRIIFGSSRLSFSIPTEMSYNVPVY